MAEDCLVVKEYMSRFGLHGKHWIRWGGDPHPTLSLEERGVKVETLVRYKDEGIECYHLWVFWREESSN